MSKFKVGDRVIHRYLGVNHYGIIKEIEDVYEDGTLISIPEYYIVSNQQSYWALEVTLQLDNEYYRDLKIDKIINESV